jgi:hypothetical protein
MPALSLVVCVHNARNLLDRLLRKADGCYDELVVVHDGPESTGISQPRGSDANTTLKPLAIDFDTLPEGFQLPAAYHPIEDAPKFGSVHELVVRYRGRFFQPPRLGSLEGQSAFAWSCATHDWILRLDADEFPSEEMKDWISRFRQGDDPEPCVSGYTCIWPIWNGTRTVTEHWPAGRIFLFNRQRVRFFGQVEQTPIPDGRYEALTLTLHHQPRRRSHGLRNVLFRKQAYVWRELIARGLLGKPTDFPRWRWGSEIWPERWEEVRRNPIRTAFSRLVMDSLRTFRDQWKNERQILFNTGINGSVHHAIFCIQFWLLRCLQRDKPGEKQTENKFE